MDGDNDSRPLWRGVCENVVTCRLLGLAHTECDTLFRHDLSTVKTTKIIIIKQDMKRKGLLMIFWARPLLTVWYNNKRFIGFSWLTQNHSLDQLTTLLSLVLLFECVIDDLIVDIFQKTAALLTNARSTQFENHFLIQYL